MLPDEVCCSRRAASPWGFGLEWTLQLPEGTHPGRIMCHATSPSAVINNSLSVLLWDFSIIKQLSKTSNKPVKMFLERWTVIDTCLFHGQAVVDRLLSKTTDNSLLISRFQEFLEMEDVRYYVMSSVRENVCKVMDKNKGVRELCLAVAVLFFYCFHCHTKIVFLQLRK